MRVCLAGFLLGCLAGGLTPGSASALQLPEYTRDPIVVTATRTATPASLVGSTVEIVTGDELRETGASTLLEALAFIPGLALTRAGAAAGTGTVMMRGAKSDHLLVLVDGIAVNDPISPGNVFDFGTIPSDAIERIEIVKGPQSTLFGSDAVAGVVNIITRSPGPEGTRWLSVESGSYRTLNTAAGFTGLLGRTGVRLELARRRLGGISSAAERYGNTEGDDWSMWSGVLSLERAVGTGRLSTVLRGTRSRFDIDDFGGPFGDDPNAWMGKNDLTGSVRWQASLGEDWTHTLLIGATTIRRWGHDRADPDHPGESVESEYRGLVQSAEWQHEIRRGGHRLAAGVSWERQSGRSRYSSLSGGWLFTSLVPWSEQSVAAVYVQDQLPLGPAALTAGGRVDAWSGYGAHPTVRLTAALPAGNMLFRASLGTGFRTPSLYQRFSPDYGNDALLAERTAGWDLGVRAPLAGRGEVRLTHYAQNVTDLIDFITDPETWESRYENRSRVRLQGWELETRVALTGRLGAQGSMTLMEARDETAGEYLIRRPRITLTLGLQWQAGERLSGALRARHVGSRTDIDFSAPPYPAIDLEPVTLFEGEATWDLTGHLALRLRLRNITDARPEWVWGYGAMGRAVFLGVLMK